MANCPSLRHWIRGCQAEKTCLLDASLWPSRSQRKVMEKVYRGVSSSEILTKSHRNVDTMTIQPFQIPTLCSSTFSRRHPLFLSSNRYNVDSRSCNISKHVSYSRGQFSPLYFGHFFVLVPRCDKLSLFPSLQLTLWESRRWVCSDFTLLSQRRLHPTPLFLPFFFLLFCSSFVDVFFFFLARSLNLIVCCVSLCFPSSHFIRHQNALKAPIRRALPCPHPVVLVLILCVAQSGKK